jgi:hypothetical protein
LELTAEDIVDEKQQSKYYSSDQAELAKKLPTSFTAPKKSSSPKTVFLTGGTGFLGPNIINQLVRDTSCYQCFSTNNYIFQLIELIMEWSTTAGNEQEELGSESLEQFYL